MSQTKLDTFSDLYKSLENFPEVGNLIQILMTHPVTNCAIIEYPTPADDLAEVNHGEREALQSGQDAYTFRRPCRDQVSNEDILFLKNHNFLNLEAVLLKLLIFFCSF